MIVYVESNFVLEIALFQEEFREAGRILELAEAKSVDLVFPGFSVSEPFSKVAFMHVDRTRLAEDMQKETRLLRQSTGKEETASEVEQASITLLGVMKIQTDNVEATVGRMLKVGHVIEVNSTVFAKGLAYEKEHDLAPKDAIIYGSIMLDLESKPKDMEKCFVTRDKDLSIPGIKSEMRELGCQVLFSFKDALNLIKARLAAQLSDTHAQ